MQKKEFRDLHAQEVEQSGELSAASLLAIESIAQLKRHFEHPPEPLIRRDILTSLNVSGDLLLELFRR